LTFKEKLWKECADEQFDILIHDMKVHDVARKIGENVKGG